MNELTELLTEVADEAKSYGGVDHAVRIMRRRRRMARLVPAAAAVIVAAGLTLTYVAVQPDKAGDLVRLPTVAAIPTGAVSWLPATLTVPSTDPPPLPTTRGVGPASLIYGRGTPLVHGTTSPGQEAITSYLVAVDGGQYRLPPSAWRSLSPDGRWLLSVQGERIVLRDLTGSAATDLGEYTEGRFVAMWASDTSRLAFETSTSEDHIIVRPDEPSKVLTYDQATVVELPSGQTHTVGVSQFTGTRVCGVQDNGDLILCSSVLAEDRLSVWVADGRTGRERSHITADLSSTLTESERQAESMNPELGLGIQPLAGGTTLLVRTNQYFADPGITVPHDLLAVDLGDGHATRRLDLPDQQPGEAVPIDHGVRFAYTQGWDVLSALPDGVLLARTGPRGTGPDAFMSIVEGLELLDPVSGQRTAVTTVSGDVARVMPRGATSNVF